MTTEEFLEEWNNSSSTVLVHTSGSTGKPKPMLVEKSRMLASARITCDYLGLKAGDTALLCMPLDYIAGKMMVIRSIERKLNLYAIKPTNHPLATPVATDRQVSFRGSITDDSLLEAITEGLDFAAMVPSQVYCSLQVPEERERLTKIKKLIIGGGAISNELQQALQMLPNKVYSTYGMTETLSHIALRELVGDNASEWYTPFEGVEVSLNDEGCLVIDAPLVHEGTLTTNDLAEIAPDGRRFRILGRRDNVICSGGIKLQSEKIEDAIRPFMTAPYAIAKRPDEKFGEVVVLVMEQKDLPELKLDNPYFMPKAFIHVDHIPLTETGKIKRSKLCELI